MSEHTLSEWPTCSAGTAVITPDWTCSIAGNINQIEETSQVNSDLEVNYLVTLINRVPFILVSIDVLFSSELLRILVYRKLRTCIKDLKLTHIVIQASHTHSAPSVDKFKPRLGRLDKRFVLSISEKLCQSIKTSIKGPCETVTSVQHGRGTCSENIYRRKVGFYRIPKKLFFRHGAVAAPNDSCPVDHEVRISVLMSANKKAAAIFWSYPCHPVSNYPVNSVSADFPGFVRSVMRGVLADENIPVLYFPGFCGDVRPKILRIGRKVNFSEILSTPFIRRFSRPSMESYEHLKKQIKESTLVALNESARKKPVVANGKSKFKYTQLPLSELFDNFDGGSDKYLRNWKVDLPPISLDLYNAEVSSSYCKNSIQDGYFPSGCTNSVYGYLPTDQQITQGGYEVSESLQFFGIKGSYKNRIANTLYEGIGLKVRQEGRE